MDASLWSCCTLSCICEPLHTMDRVQRQPDILRLDDSSLLLILCCHKQLSHLDVLRSSRCCKRLHALCQSDLVWSCQYTAVFGDYDQHGASSYRQVFRERLMHEASEQRMKRRVQRYRLQSDISTLQRDLKHKRAQLEHELREQKRVNQELRRLQHAKLVQSVPSQLFHLNAVKLYHNQVVQASPVTLAAELANLQQQQRVSQVELKTLQAGIKSRQQRLNTCTRQLAALEG